jgi:hypothetical protein
MLEPHTHLGQREVGTTPASAVVPFELTNPPDCCGCANHPTIIGDTSGYT